MQAKLKRLTDLLGATGGLLILGIPMVLIAVLVRIKLGHPVLFRHVRPGLFGQPFTLLKFRTMGNAHGPGGSLKFALEHSDKDRITSFGSWLRATSLDELPELFNVLKGEMSLVGPRPLMMEYLGYYSPEQARRHEVRPGMTGWAQIHGRTTISWDEKFKRDVWYVDNWSIWLDLKILIITVKQVLLREGVTPEQRAIVPSFMMSDNAIVEDERVERGTNTALS